MIKENIKKIIQTYEDSSKVEKLILIDLLKDFLAYNSGVKVEKKGMNAYWFNKYFTHEKINLFNIEAEKLSKKQQEEIFKGMVLSITGFTHLKDNEVFGHIPVDKARKFTPELKEEIKVEELGLGHTTGMRNNWTRILSDCKLLKISKYQYLPNELKDEIKNLSKIKDKDDKLLNYYQGVIKGYENDLARDFFNDQEQLSVFYQKSILRVVFDTKNVQVLLNRIESKENKELRYSSSTGSLIYNGEIIHTFVNKKGILNFKKLFCDCIFKREKGTYIDFSEILFEIQKQKSIINDLSKGEISFIERTKDKINRDIKKKTKKEDIILFSQEKDGNKRYIYRNH